MASPPTMAQAKSSCSRCHKRKKRCDRNLPQCRNCCSAHVACSFLEDDRQTATYPIAFVRRLEERIKDLEARLVELSRSTSQPSMLQHQTEPPVFADHAATFSEVNPNETIDASQGNMATIYLDPYNDHMSVVTTVPHQPSIVAPCNITAHQSSPTGDESPSFVAELKTLSLEATAERHLGSSSGLSFARLTQTILRRLAPDKAEFVFGHDLHEYNSATSSFDFNFASSEILNYQTFQNMSNSLSTLPAAIGGGLCLADLTEPDEALAGLTLPTDDTDLYRIIDFYFAHSHTLYPIVDRPEFLSTLQFIRENPHDILGQSPQLLFRIWMVLAIGSTAAAAVSLTEESESMLYYNKALVYAEAALSSGEMASLEFIALQVSYSFFNQLGPNTWFLVGLAARMAVGMGLHNVATYYGLCKDIAERKKRLFWSIYMMDRVVSIALGRPFAIHDDDIDVTPFAEADEEDIKPDGVLPRNPLQPSTMSIPLHILRLRMIASKIATSVYSGRSSIITSFIGQQDTDMEARQEIVRSLHQELIEWRRNMPFPLPNVNSRVPHLSTTWYDFNYYTHLAMLYRPSPLLPTLDQPRVKILAEAAAMALRQASSMHRQERFAYNWLNLLSVFMSTLCLVYAVTAQPDDLVVVLEESHATEDLQLAVELFDKLSVKFSSAKRVLKMVQQVMQRYKDICNGVA